MPITLTETIKALESGAELTWTASGPFRASTIQLATPAARRLAEFLLDQDPDSVQRADEGLFAGLHTAWKDDEHDPADGTSSETVTNFTGPWRLTKVESKGFGGINAPDGPPFEMEIAGENWCVVGYNGSGKTSLSSLILWTLTGYRNREQNGPIRERGAREPVFADSGQRIGTWPPLVTYPLKEADIGKTAKAWAQLTFTDPDGNEAFATRAVESPVDGTPQVTEAIDPRLTAAPELIETGLLMPARIGHIGFGERSQSLHHALKLLTGLDKLASVATGAANFGHKAKRFLKYAKDNGADGLERDYANNLGQAKELADKTEIDLSASLELGEEKLHESLAEIEKEASSKAGEALNTLTTELSPVIDLADSSDRDRLNNAVGRARLILDNGTKNVQLFQSWKALTVASEDAEFKGLNAALHRARDDLEEALSWHANQQVDQKLRLKALAASFFLPVDNLEYAAKCPLCETNFTSEKQQALGAELAALKKDAGKASRRIKDACSDVSERLETHLPDALNPHLADLVKMEPKKGLVDALRALFCDSPPFSDILTGMAQAVTDFVGSTVSDLPDFEYASEDSPKSDIPSVIELNAKIRDFTRLAALSEWWCQHRQAYLAAWQGLIGIENEDGEWPVNSLEGKIAKLEAAIAQSDPLDRIAKHISAAIIAAAAWDKLNEIQGERSNIAEALKPLKELQQLVDCETHRSVETLSGRVASILDDIQLCERFTYTKSAMTKKSVTVEGRFAEGLNIDAALVANSSWLRALLWAFIFALREQTVEDRGANQFPLMVLDDPQTTFDPKNKNKWAQRIVSIANKGEVDKAGIQLFLTTHEQRFSETVCTRWMMTGQQAEIIEPTISSKVMHIVNGTFLERRFEKAQTAGSNTVAYEYIQMVRVYCEDLLKIMLRPESHKILGDTLGRLRGLLVQLRKDHVAPYNRRPFGDLIKLLDEKKQPMVKIIHDSHHVYDGTVGLAEAKDVRNFWNNKLQKAIVNTYRLLADFEAYGGAPYLFAWQDNVAVFPNGHQDKIHALGFKTTGVVAAALSDGRVGDGQISLDALPETVSVTLGNHSAYRLNTGSIDPVAGVGDVVLVQEFGTPRSSNLVVAAFGNRLYARRVTESPDHEDLIILTGQSTDPYALPEPVIALKDKVKVNKIVGTVFTSQILPPPTASADEVTGLEDFSILQGFLDGTDLFQVKGRSMEPIALQDQYVMTRDEALNKETLTRLNGELVIAADENGAVYFKRLRCHGEIVALESANSSATTSSELLTLADVGPYPKLTVLKSVIGVLFELPGQT
jgi:hypothetical protein